VSKKATASSKVCFISGILAVISAPGVGYAASFEYGGKAGFEHFQWEEFSSEGHRYLKESGTRNVISGFLGNTMKSERHFIYSAEAKVYFGTVNYDGETIATQTQPSEPIQSETTYSGLSIGGETGLRAGNIDSPFAWDFVGRADVDTWIRDLADTTTSGGNPVRGTREEYTIMNIRAGTGPNWRTDRWHGRLIAGFKYPFYTNEYISRDYTNFDRDLTLEPKGRISPFLYFYNHIKLSNRLWLTIDAYYETYRFDKSDSVVAYDNTNTPYNVWQPKSQQDNYGLQAGVVVSF
jgi:hypothetical protein